MNMIREITFLEKSADAAMSLITYPVPKDRRMGIHSQQIFIHHLNELETMYVGEWSESTHSTENNSEVNNNYTPGLWLFEFFMIFIS